MRAICVVGVAFLAAMSPFADTGAADLRIEGLQGPVQVCTDGHGVPHIYAQSDSDAALVLGYLHAANRLWEMDLFRRQASGTMSELFGKDRLPSDILVRQLGIRRGCEQLWESGGLPEPLRNIVEAYTRGVNAKRKELGEDGLPPIFKQLGYSPAPWTPVDCLVFGKYMAWDQSGTDDDLWFGMIADKMGPTATQELWPLERPYEIPTVEVQADRKMLLSQSALSPIHEAQALFDAAYGKIEAAGWWGRGGSFGSNNWAVDGTKTASGKPMLCSDPHLGFHLPSIWYTCHLSTGGRNVAGVTFPGCPIVIIGHNDHIAWGITNLQADAVDYFVETINPDDPTQYRHRGEWKKLERITEKIAVKGEEPYTLDIDSTVHGPIISREGGKSIALAWTGLGPTKDMAALWSISQAGNLKEFLTAADNLTAPALNLVYADDAGNIALHPCGALPLRLAGQGRIPMDGASGENDWTGMIPRNEMPLAVNPPDHFVASANNRPASVGYPHYLGWMWDPSYRKRRINDMLSKASHLTVDSMRAIQTDALDKSAEVFLPVLLAAVRPGDLKDAYVKSLYDALRAWDYIASVDALGPAIWQRWLGEYRKAVWDDEWPARGIEKRPGSWGFCGENEREPMMEVLEYLTREQPDAIWFDDRTTPDKHETRDDCIVKSFTAAATALQKQFGDDIQKLMWRNINVLKIASLTGAPELARDGGPVPGSMFTVNPGSDNGPVGGGASWRMIVDFGDLSKSVGVYPGGQSEDPSSPFYADQMAIWAAGEYLPLHMLGSPDLLTGDAKTTTVSFVP